MDVPVTHYHTCHTQSCLSNIIVNVILVPLLATVLWLWPLIAAVPGSKAMNRRRKLGLSALLRPLPYPLVPSFDAGWSQCDQIWKQAVMYEYPVFVSLLSFWDTILLCGWFFFDKNQSFLSEISRTVEKNNGHLSLSGWVACRSLWNFIRGEKVALKRRSADPYRLLLLLLVVPRRCAKMLHLSLAQFASGAQSGRSGRKRPPGWGGLLSREH